MKKSLTLLSVFAIGLCFAQTKTIYNKRHFVLTKNSSSLFVHNDHVVSNFGAAPERWVKNSKLVKVKLLNDTSAIMTTEEDCYETYSRTETRWRAGSDTVYNHAIFCSKIPVDSMRSILKDQYYFTNDMNKVQFEGFDSSYNGAKTKRKSKKEEKITTGPFVDFDLITKKEEDKKKFGHKKGQHLSKWVVLIVVVTTVLGISRIR